MLETGLRFCAHTGGVQDKNAVAVLGSCGSGMGSCGSGMDRAVFLDWISPAHVAIFNKLGEILDCFGYMRYM